MNRTFAPLEQYLENIFGVSFYIQTKISNDGQYLKPTIEHGNIMLTIGFFKELLESAKVECVSFGADGEHLFGRVAFYYKGYEKTGGYLKVVEFERLDGEWKFYKFSKKETEK